MAKAGAFLDDLVKGMTKGLDSTQQIKASVNRVSSNMTDATKKAARTAKIKKGLNLKPSMDKAVETARQVSGDSSISTVQKIKLGGGTAGPLNRNKIRQVAGNTKTVTIGSDPSFAQQTGDFFGGGIRETIKNYKDGDTAGNLVGSFTKAHTKTGADGKPVLDMKRAAGTYMAASVGARVLSGGGLYKDRNGNTNLPGIPFL